jgi:DnaJ family protein A protein 2
MEDKTKITIEGQSGISDPDQEPGDVVVVIDTVVHDHFQRVGNDLIFQKQLSAAETVSGCECAVTHLDGRLMTVSFLALTS